MYSYVIQVLSLVGSTILLEDSQLIIALLEIAQNAIKGSDQTNQSIVYLAGTLLLLIGKHGMTGFPRF